MLLSLQIWPPKPLDLVPGPLPPGPKQAGALHQVGEVADRGLVSQVQHIGHISRGKQDHQGTG